MTYPARRGLIGLILSTTASLAAAQPCTPAWDGGIGTPGIGDGYVGPMFAWNDGSGEALYVGGSYTEIGDLSTRGVAKWNPGTGTWSALAGGCYSTFTNSFSAAISSYDFGSGDELVVGGSFATADGLPDTQNLARWDGSTWTGIPGGQPDGAIWAMTVWNNHLYVGGGFTTIGGVTASGIASYTQEEGWRPLGTGVGTGFSPNVFALKVYNDGSGEKLYIAGRFDSIGGVTGLIARWNGLAWQAIGMGVRGAITFSGIEALAIHNDGTGPALYAGGWDLRPNGTGATSSVVKWNGSTWSRAGQYLGGRTTSLLSWDDGAGAALYNGGTAQPGIGYIARLQGATWTAVDGGVSGSVTPGNFPSVFGLAEFQGDLVVGGSFAQAGTVAANGLVIRTGCGEECPADLNGDGIVDFGDYLEFLNFYDASDSRADFNGDGIVDFSDYLEFLNHYDAGC